MDGGATEGDWPFEAIHLGGLPPGESSGAGEGNLELANVLAVVDGINGGDGLVEEGAFDQRGGR